MNETLEKLEKLIAKASQILEIEPNDTNVIALTSDARFRLENDIAAAISQAQLELENDAIQRVAGLRCVD